MTAEEFQELSRASLLGTLTSKDDLLFMLRQIRAAMNPTAPPSHEPTLPDINHLAETMRLKALAKLDELDLKAELRRKSAVGRVEAALERVRIEADTRPNIDSADVAKTSPPLCQFATEFEP